MAQTETKTDLTLTESLSIQIERDIVEGKLLPGDKLDEEVLAARRCARHCVRWPMSASFVSSPGSAPR